MTAELRALTVHIDTGRWSGTVLEAVDLVVRPGRITAVLGAPGAGKSMIASALTGQLPAAAKHRGQVRINDEVVHDRQWQTLRGRVVGYVPQDGVTAFGSEETVGAQLRALARHHRAWSVERACAAAYYPADAADLLPSQNSAGQIQRAALAAALLPAPPILIADGPTNSLDAGTACAVWKSLRDYADSGAAVLVVSNEVRMLAAGGFADRMVIVDEGRVRAAGSTAQLARSTDPYVRALLGSPF
ncbi:ATP-binding cassette domain-containing protein [Nocardia mexicana]|uniref:Peptide/nickel transport system ATP-binding protein n=1 Tax=Nocardia mexicana TaxID=279262 RepID=A0A370GGJ9_9NOCA|nr:ATP-binding cassette domain-containing protein [Nocardia mexicana]RDI42925.1 peptide/nickel transport system ATP-binding protein [Nocardia mexicana]